MIETWASGIYKYYTQLQLPQNLPGGVEWLYPQKEKIVLETLKTFLAKFYNDKNKRELLLGINPGRFGAGVTGINFTAPKQLEEHCKISHPFKNGSELSAEFIYRVIDAYGGVEQFYNRYFIASVCPFGFTQNRKNLNYYDDPALLRIVYPFIVQSIEKLLSLNVLRETCICIGGEKNYRFLSSLNEKHRWFNKIYPVPHPRFIMQYKRQTLDQYVQIYLDALN